MICEFKGEHRWLSNFALVTIEWDGYTYPSVENAYQAQKCGDPDYKQFCTTCTPGAAKKVGAVVNVGPWWDNQHRLSLMMELTRLKYQDRSYKYLLLQTGDEEIVEGNTWGDTFFGKVLVGGKPKHGANHLGHIIMKVRDELRNGGLL